MNGIEPRVCNGQRQQAPVGKTAEHEVRKMFWNTASEVPHRMITQHHMEAVEGATPALSSIPPAVIGRTGIVGQPEIVLHNQAGLKAQPVEAFVWPHVSPRTSQDQIIHVI